MFIVASVFTTIYSNAQTSNYWVKKADFLGLKRARSVSFVLGQKMYVSCGVDTAEIVHNDLWEYDPATDSWSQRADLPGSARRNAVAVEFADKALVGLGLDNDDASIGNRLVDIWEYNASLNSWTQGADFPGGDSLGVYNASAFAHGKYMYVCGGKIGPSNYLEQLWAYDTDLHHWLRLADFPGGVRNKLSSFAIDGVGYVGMGEDQDIYHNDLWAYDIDQNIWSQKTSLPSSGRANASSFVLQDRGYILFGENGGYLKELWEYNPSTDSWTNRASYGGSARRYAVAGVIGDIAYAGLGQGQSGKKQSFYAYVPPYLSVNNVGITSINVYPNPCTELIAFSTNVDNVQVYSVSGRLVLSANSISKLDVSSLADGTYTVHLSVDNRVSMSKIIKL